MAIKIFIFFLLLSLQTFSQEKPRQAVPAQKKGTTFNVSWDYKDFPLKIQMYEIKNPKVARVGGMGKIDNIANSFLANPISNGKLFVPENDRYTFALIVENNTGKRIFFHVVPHEVTPEEYSLGTKFNCLCYGHIYSIPPGKIWYRIVALMNLTPQLGNQFSIRHKVIGLEGKTSFEDAKEFQEGGQ